MKKIFISTNPADKTHNNGKASAITAARDEKEIIEGLIKAFKSQDISGCELLIVDDYSISGIAADPVGDSSDIKIIKNNLPPGKKNALTCGVIQSKNENILLTDSDCIPEPGWLKSFLFKFNQGYDLLFGISPFILNGSLVSKISGFENMRGFMLSFSAHACGLTYSAAARNFGYTKAAFKKMNGYNNTMEIPFGDDGLLIREAVKHKLKIGAVTEGNSFVYTFPKPSFKEYFQQRKRHTRTSFYYSSKIKLMLAGWHMMNLLPVLLIFLVPLHYSLMFPFLIKITADSMLVKRYQKRLGYRFSLTEILFLQVIYEFFIILNFINASFGVIKWKPLTDRDPV